MQMCDHRAPLHLCCWRLGEKLILLVVQVNQWISEMTMATNQSECCASTAAGAPWPWQKHCVYFGHSRLHPCLWHQWVSIKNTPKLHGHSQGDTRLSWTCADHKGELLLAVSLQHRWIRSLMLDGRWTPTQVPAKQAGPTIRRFVFFFKFLKNGKSL